MKLNVTFSEGDKNFAVAFDENGNTIDSGMGEVQIVEGKPGKDGVSPIVELEETEAGVNITVTDTEGEKQATVMHGAKGDTGEPGTDGLPGKTAYQYALEGGYTGTEEEFAAKMAQEIPVVDETSTVRGAAADAKLTGDRMNAILRLVMGKQPAGDYALRSELAAPVVAYDGTLAVNTVYTANLSGAVAFALPTPADVTRENRIRMLANVAADTSIDWGTTTYYGAAVPFVNEGHYEFLWDYNPLLGAWVAGATRIGQVVAG